MLPTVPEHSAPRWICCSKVALCFGSSDDFGIFKQTGIVKLVSFSEIPVSHESSTIDTFAKNRYHEILIQIFINDDDYAGSISFL